MSTLVVRDYLLQLQMRIVKAMEAEDGCAFVADHWLREPGEKLQGEGRSLTSGELAEIDEYAVTKFRGIVQAQQCQRKTPAVAGVAVHPLATDRGHGILAVRS